jgi:hypothetical protein
MTYLNMKEATVIMATCQKHKSIFGIRAEKKEEAWRFTWAFPLDRKAAEREGYDSTTVNGIIEMDAEYPGCPHCKGDSFVRCGSCSKIACWDSKNTEFRCPSCGIQGIVTIAKSFDDIKAGGY